MVVMVLLLLRQLLKLLLLLLFAAQPLNPLLQAQVFGVQHLELSLDLYKELIETNP